MSGVSLITGVESRIAAIRARMGAVRGASTMSSIGTDLPAPADPLDGFDPFGDVYQQALIGAGITSPQAAGGGGFTSSSGLRGEALAGAAAAPTSASLAATTGRAVRVSPVTTTMAPASYVDGGYVDRGAASTPSVTGSGSSIGKVGGYGAMPVPAELQAYGNGHIPAGALVSIGQGGHRLWAPAATQWKRLVADAAADGVSIGVTDSYRSYEEQVDLAERKGLYKDGGYAATPGTSNHGWGLAVDADINQPAALLWMKANAFKYGFVEAVPREPWHWEYRPSQA